VLHRRQRNRIVPVFLYEASKLDGRTTLEREGMKSVDAGKLEPCPFCGGKALREGQAMSNAKEQRDAFVARLYKSALEVWHECGKDDWYSKPVKCGLMFALEHDLMAYNDLPPDAPPPAPAEGKCSDCGALMNEGEARTFTVCDACWKKKYPGVEASEGGRA
jgi:hypothetical protein